MIKQKAKDIIAPILASMKITAPPVDVFQIARSQNIALEETSFNTTENPMDRIEGELARDEVRDQWVIRFESKSNYNRQRFTVAHELGHFFMHKIPVIDRARVFRRSLQWDRKELEANVFAAELLMPISFLTSTAKHILPTIINIEDFITKMAEIFSVSRQAMTYRLKNLKVIK